MKKKGYQKMIFVLTDGETQYSAECLNLAETKQPAHTIIHTFGVGNSCDVPFVERLAAFGQGICEVIRESEVGQLRAKVIEVLSKTLQPSYKEVKTKLSVKDSLKSCNLKNHAEIHRHQLYTQFFIVDEKAGDARFDLEYLDPYKKAKVTIKVAEKDFLKIPKGSMLSEVAVHYKIKQLEANMKSSNEVSLKYQVLGKDTAMVGVIKNTKTKEAISSVEMKHVTINDIWEQQRRNFRHFNMHSGHRGGRGGAMLQMDGSALNFSASHSKSRMKCKKVAAKKSSATTVSKKRSAAHVFYD